MTLDNGELDIPVELFERECKFIERIIPDPSAMVAYLADLRASIIMIEEHILKNAAPELSAQ